MAYQILAIYIRGCRCARTCGGRLSRRWRSSGRGGLDWSFAQRARWILAGKATSSVPTPAKGRSAISFNPPGSFMQESGTPL